MFEIKKIKSSAEGSLFSSVIHYLPEVDSTNKFAKSLSSDSDCLILTDYQTHGLGRMGKQWVSENGKNLTFTLVKHFKIEPENIQTVNFFFSYFLLAFLKDFTAKNLEKNKLPKLEIKWPNDILADSKKMSGFLIENSGNKNQFIIGIGLNVNQEKFPKEFINYTTSLNKILGRDIDINGLIIDLLNVYSKNIHLVYDKKYKIIYNLWKESSYLIGKEVNFINADNLSKTGKIIDLQYDGGLKMYVNGELITYYSGDIKLVRKNP